MRSCFQATRRRKLASTKKRLGVQAISGAAAFLVDARLRASLTRAHHALLFSAAASPREKNERLLPRRSAMSFISCPGLPHLWPNQALQPTRTSVTPRAFASGVFAPFTAARGAPAVRVADL